MHNQNRKVILLLDNAPCHATQLQLTNVKLQFLPPNTTAKLQPLDQGIIQAFKLGYRKRVLRSVIAHMDEVTNTSDLAKKITVSDAISWITSAWTEIRPSTITKCFQHCTFPGKLTIESVPQEEPDDLKILAEVAGIPDFDAAAVQGDDTLECYDDLKENWKEQAMQEFLEGKIYYAV